jgi:hypothetical protein
VNEVIRDEQQAERDDQTLWRYLKIEQKDGHEETRAVCETKDGKIDRLLAIDGQPLTSEQNRREDERIRMLLADPEEVRKQEIKRQKDQDSQMALLRMFSKAFQYKYESRNGNVVALHFVPNPDFHPSRREGQVFHHMTGTVWIDIQQKRLAGVDGRLTGQVDFGGGFFGYLKKGGTFSVHLEQDDGSGHWNMVSLQIHLKGRALLFKTIGLEQEERRTNYRINPAGTTLQQAVLLLRNEATSLAASSQAEAPKTGN